MKAGNFRRQLGFTAIELMVVIIVAVGAMILGGDATNTYMNNLDNQNAAQHAIKVREATQKYIKDNFAALELVATPASPATITIAMLQATNNLDASFNATNGFGQAYSIKVLQPTAGQLQTLIVTTGGGVIPEMSLRRAAQLIGAQGGYISSSNTAVATGSYGGWSTALPGNYGVSPGAGHLAVGLFFADSGAVSDFLYRNSVAGRADLNTMNAPIIMSSVQTSGLACPTTGAIARDNSGAVLSCQGTWKTQGSSYWQDSVANNAALQAITCNAAASGQTRVVMTPTVGTGARAYTCNGAGAWQALGVDDSGNLTVAGAITTASLTASGRVSANTLRPTLVAVAGASCAGYQQGDLAQDAAGLTLSCQSGVWAKQASGGVITVPQWPSTYNDRCTVKVYVSVNQWDQYCYRSATNAVDVLVWYPTTTILWTTNFAFYSCVNAETQKGCANGIFSLTPGGIMWNNGNGFYPWLN